ncbi:cell division protein FtsQ/DivIB [Heyndrickxia ginsengihumi]|uniref:cell division protein FtsQ/DivIB n=1 Tax=Heyndrickxia ginsengihumi TaxID=363870 RepID=UPI003D1DE38A
MVSQDKNIVSIEDRIPKLKQQRKRKTNRRLILLISSFFLLVIFIIYFQSPLSHVKQVQVTGNETVEKQEIIKKSGISSKTNIWNIRKKNIAEKIESIPEVNQTTIHIALPNTIQIHIKEHTKIGYLQNKTNLYPVLEDGTIVHHALHYVSTDAIIFTNFKEDRVLKDMLQQFKKLPKQIVSSISEVKYTPSKMDKELITLYMNNGFEVRASIPTFAEKMVHYPSIISQLNPNQKGVIDLEVGTYFKAFDTKKKH